MAARQYLSLAFLKVGCAAASAMLVGIGICHIGALYKKARTKAGNGNVVEGLLGLVSASIVEVGGRVVLALAPVHLDGAGMVGGIGDAFFFPTELPSLGFHGMVDSGLCSFAHC